MPPLPPPPPVTATGGAPRPPPREGGPNAADRVHDRDSHRRRATDRPAAATSRRDQPSRRAKTDVPSRAVGDAVHGLCRRRDATRSVGVGRPGQQAVAGPSIWTAPLPHRPPPPHPRTRPVPHPWRAAGGAARRDGGRRAARAARPVGVARSVLDEAIKRALAVIGDMRVKTSWMDSAPSTAASPMPQDPDWAGGTIYEDIQEASSTAAPADLFATVTGVGGERGWYVANFLWTLRGWLDKLIGGVGMRRGRRHPDDLRVGDALDFFRVEAHEAPRLLRLRAEMIVPGDAWLEWRISENPDGSSCVRQLARFIPRGVSGRAYWWVLLPIHKVMWKQLALRLAAAAEQRQPERR